MRVFCCDKYQNCEVYRMIREVYRMIREVYEEE